ncbi:MAG: tail fiber domain-containing protein, partial [Patescibacteria group bacterium]|nr:tail fiber domain-containing protein [Patescibacteria group bacterium]
QGLGQDPTDATPTLRLYGLNAAYSRIQCDDATTLGLGTITDAAGSGFSEKLVIEAGGDIGVGTTNPGAQLHVYSAADEKLRLANSSATGNPYLTFFQGNFRRSMIQHVDVNDNLKIISEYGELTLWTGTGGTEVERITILSGGDVGIGDDSPAYRLEIGGGDVNTTGGGYRDAGSCVAGTCASDVQLKHNIQSLEGSLGKILQLNPATFSFSDPQYGSTDQNYGLIAQEVEGIFPDWVVEGDDGYKNVRYGLNIQMNLIKAIQEQQIQIEELSESLEGLGVTYWSLSEDETTLSTPLNIVANEVSGTTGVFSLLNAEALRIGDDKFVVDSFGNVDVVGDLVLAGVLSGRYGDFTVRLGDSLGNNMFAIQNVLGESVFEIDSRGKMIIKQHEENSTIGEAQIPIGEVSIIINSSAITENSKVFVTSRVQEGEVPALSVKDIADGYFEVRIESPVSQPIDFDWWVIN